jgi:hypothetical protein
MNAGCFSRFLKRMLAASEHKIFWIVDGYPMPKAQKVRDFVEARPKQIELQLPARLFARA